MKKLLLSLLLFSSFCADAQSYTTSNCRNINVPTGEKVIKETKSIQHDTTKRVHGWLGWRNKTSLTPWHDTTLTRTETTYDTRKVCDTTYLVIKPVTIFGMFTTGNTPIKDKIATYRRCGVTHIRYTIQLADWVGIDRPLQQYIDSGFLIHLNIIWAAGQPRHYPTDLPLYKQRLTEVLNLYKNAVIMIVCENEPINKDYYYEPYSDYFVVLKACIEVCNKYNKPVADGGTTRLIYSLHNYYYKKNKTDSLAWLENIIGHYNVNSPTYIDNLQVNEDYLNGIKATGITYGNFHYKEPKDTLAQHPSGILTAMINYLRGRLGRDVTLNEVGFKNQSDTLAQETYDELIKARILFPIIFHTPGLPEGEAGAKPLTPKGEVILSGYTKSTSGTVSSSNY